MGLRKLRVCHNDLLLRLTGVTSWGSATVMLAYVHLDDLGVILRKLSYRFSSGIQNRENCLTKATCVSNCFMKSRLFKKWRLTIDI